MTRNKPTSKQSDAYPRATQAVRALKVTVHKRQPQRMISAKRPLSEDGKEILDPPAKRSKAIDISGARFGDVSDQQGKVVMDNTPAHIHADVSADQIDKGYKLTAPRKASRLGPATNQSSNLSDFSPEQVNSKLAVEPVGSTLEHNWRTSENIPSPPAQTLPLEIAHLQSNYKFTTMSILSSAKIQQKVRNLLLRVEQFSFADPKAKPGIVILHAKSEVTSKMVSIIHIARQTIEKEKGKWWQYSKLDGQLAETKVERTKRADDAKTFSDWSKENHYDGAEAECTTGRASRECQDGQELIDEDDDMVDAFETMDHPQKRSAGVTNVQGSSGKQVRMRPVMTVYFARVPVPGLKELYGYVCRQFHASVPH